MRKAAISILRKIQEAGHTAYFAGGCVRDRILGLEPKDYDIATDATPEQVLDIFPKGDSIGAHFGVILVKRSGFHFEIATFREDGVYSDGRRPDTVTFTDVESDAGRRDFTVNGMFEDPIKEEVIDFVGGVVDLKSRTLRAIGDPQERFAEDYLRMMRAIRFATCLNFEIEAETWSGIQAKATKIDSIAPERMQQELNKIWQHANRVKGFDLLVSSGLMEQILPEITGLKGCEQPPEFHPEGDVFTHTRLMLDLLPDDASLTLVMAVLFHDIGKPDTQTFDEEGGRIRFNGHDKLGAEMVEKILLRLRYSNEISEAVVSGVMHHMQFANVQNMRLSTLKRFMAREGFDEQLTLHRVDCLGSNGNLENYQFLVDKKKEFANAPIIPKPFLNGRDLITRGVKPGPKMGVILTEAQDLQLEGRLEDRDAAVLWLDRKVKEASC